ncbi:hypothetical protein SAMN05216233_104176 [Desulfoluna spongiiphila]|uniref:Uncharacterized protein n=1 Tax=Desulfoluna spongiiphila TaxID=419481 RepID=A0A1G5DG63_9BACT|nr:hypothetical protein SAMN05216233_104176 [Desulfoluna spongiiphila]
MPSEVNFIKTAPAGSPGHCANATVTNQAPYFTENEKSRTINNLQAKAPETGAGRTVSLTCVRPRSIFSPSFWDRGLDTDGISD